MENNETVQKNNKVLYVIIAILMAALIGVGGYTLFIKGDSKEKDNSKDPKQEEKKEPSAYKNYKETDFFREKEIIVIEEFSTYLEKENEEVISNITAKIVNGDIEIEYNDLRWITKADAKYLFAMNAGCQSYDSVVLYFIGNDGYLYAFDEYIGVAVYNEDSLFNFTYTKVDTSSKVLEFFKTDVACSPTEVLAQVLLDTGEKLEIKWNN